MPRGRKRLQTAFCWQLLVSRILNEITLILDTLLRSKHLSVETCHPHMEFSSFIELVALDHGKSEVRKWEMGNPDSRQERASTSKFSKKNFEHDLVTLLKP